MLKWRLALLAAGALGLVAVQLAGSATPRPLGAEFYPITGTWSNAAGGAVAVTQTGADHYKGTVTVAWNSQNGCPHPVGQAVWSLQGSGGGYTGTNLGFTPSDTGSCDIEVQNATWSITSATTLTFCANGVGGEKYPCSTYTRAAAGPPEKWRTVTFDFKGTQHGAAYFAEISGHGKIRVAEADARGLTDLVRVTSASITLRYGPHASQPRGARNVTLRVVATGHDGLVPGATYDYKRVELRYIPLKIVSSGAAACRVGSTASLYVLSQTGHTITIRGRLCPNLDDPFGRSGGFQWIDKFATVHFK